MVTGPPSLGDPLRYSVQGYKDSSSGFVFLQSDNADLTLNGPPRMDAGAGGTVANTPGVAGGAGYHTSVSTTVSMEATLAQRILTTRRMQLNLEVPFLLRPAATVNSDVVGIVKDYRAWFLTPSWRLTFVANRRIYPWLSVGAGLAHFVPGSGGPGVFASTVSKAALQSGAGVDIWPFRHFGFRTNLRNFYSGRPELGIPKINLRNTLSLSSGFLVR